MGGDGRYGSLFVLFLHQQSERRERLLAYQASYGDIIEAWTLQFTYNAKSMFSDYLIDNDLMEI